MLTKIARHPSTKILASFIVFFVLLAAVITIGLKFHSQKSQAKITLDPHQLKPSSKPLFYNNIGKIPKNFRKPKKSEISILKQRPYTVEFAVTKSKDKADQLLTHLAKKGIHAYYTPVERGGMVYYRVRKGIFVSKKDAQSYAIKMKTASRLKTKIIRLQ